MGTVVLDISLSAEQLQLVYKGQVNRIMAKARDGRRISLPAQPFRAFLTHTGIFGTFEVQFDDAGKLISLNKLA